MRTAEQVSTDLSSLNLAQIGEYNRHLATKPNDGHYAMLAVFDEDDIPTSASSVDPTALANEVHDDWFSDETNWNELSDEQNTSSAAAKNGHHPRKRY